MNRSDVIAYVEGAALVCLSVVLLGFSGTAAVGIVAWLRQ